MHPHLLAALVLQRLPDLGPATYWQLLDHFASPEAVLQHPAEQLRKLIKPRSCAALLAYQQQGRDSPVGLQVARDLQWLAEQPEVHLLGFDDAQYPPLLREIRKPPPLLYVRGDPACLRLPQIALVGSRSPTPGGRDNALSFARYLSQSGFAITSGLALGVDGAAHEGAVQGGGKTIAVLGTGIDRIYPARHRSLAEAIIANGGALVSEFPLGTSAQAGNFPQRNRIISGMSCGTLVVEAAVQSGSLITARLALEQNREVFAIPGSIHNPLARGCHHMIRQGATLVETATDIVEQLGSLLGYQESLQLPQQGEGAAPLASEGGISELSQNEQAVLRAMGFDPIDIDTLAQRVGQDVGAIAAQLIGLELQGLINTTPQGYVRRA